MTQNDKGISSLTIFQRELNMICDVITGNPFSLIQEIFFRFVLS